MCTGPDSDPLRMALKQPVFDGDEIVRLLDACMRHHDHVNGFKVAANLSNLSRNGVARNLNETQRQVLVLLLTTQV